MSLGIMNNPQALLNYRSLSKASLPDSAFLRALRIFNLNAIVEGINSDSLLGSRNLIIKRAEGDFYVGQNRALINIPIKLETAEAKMEWMGEVLKDNVGILNELNLDLEMRLKLSENMLKKHNILIDAKWHRICITPAVIISKSQTDYFIDKLTKEFKILSEKFQ